MTALTARFSELKQLRQINGQLQKLADEKQPPEPTHYTTFERIVALAADSAERHEIAAKMIEAYWFDGAEWLGGELNTLQIFEAAMRFTEQALAAGYEWTEEGWQRDGRGWSRDKVVAKVGEMVQR